MQPNLNKIKPEKVRVVLNHKYNFSSQGLDRKIFIKSLIKEFVKQNNDTYFHEDLPLSLNIEVRSMKRSSMAELENKYTTHLPNLGSVVNAVIDALSGAAFTKMNQVVEVYITKLFGNENRIIVELERI